MSIGKHYKPTYNDRRGPACTFMYIVYIYMTDPLLQSQGIQSYCQSMIKECPSSPPKRIVIWSHETGCFNWMIVTCFIYYLVDSLW